MNDMTNKGELCMAEKDVQRNHKDTAPGSSMERHDL